MKNFNADKVKEITVKAKIKPFIKKEKSFKQILNAEIKLIRKDIIYMARLGFTHLFYRDYRKNPIYNADNAEIIDSIYDEIHKYFSKLGFKVEVSRKCILVDWS